VALDGITLDCGAGALLAASVNQQIHTPVRKSVGHNGDVSVAP
jgi:hypothetical protein